MSEKIKKYNLNGADVTLIFHKSPFHVNHEEKVADLMVENSNTINKIQKILNKLDLEFINPVDLSFVLEEVKILKNKVKQNKKDSWKPDF